MIRQMTLSDIEYVVPLHIASFQRSLNIIAGKRYLKAVFRWFIQNNHIALVSESGSTITGYVIGAPIGYEKAMNSSLWITGMLGLLSNPTRLFNLKLFKNIIKRIKSIMSTNPLAGQPLVKEMGAGVSLVGIAVSPESKGDGTAGKLVEAFENEVKNYKVQFVRLSVLSENTRAQKFYEKMGWTRHETPEGYYYYKKLTN